LVFVPILKFDRFKLLLQHLTISEKQNAILNRNKTG